MTMEVYWESYDEQIIEIVCLIIVAIGTHQSTERRSIARFSSRWAGEDWIREIVLQEHPSRCIELFKMPLDTFLSLKDWLIESTELRDSRAVSAT